MTRRQPGARAEPAAVHSDTGRWEEGGFIKGKGYNGGKGMEAEG